MYTRGKQKGIQRTDEETTDNQEGSVGQSFVLLLVLNFSTFYLGGRQLFYSEVVTFMVVCERSKDWS